MGAKICPPAAGGWRGGPAAAGLKGNNEIKFMKCQIWYLNCLDRTFIESVAIIIIFPCFVCFHTFIITPECSALIGKLVAGMRRRDALVRYR